ncbi:4-hydroxy-3-methylbut-2-enyl diphosphate reductase [Actinobacillus equuli]|nr:4-hydroxy-3-methylbut-2-enyl diphosphate reductase [Actinobacillus equuli]
MPVSNQSTYASGACQQKGTKAILIGHEGHPEVIGTMGQYDNQDAGIFLVESVEDIAKLPVSNQDELTFMTQTTLSIDDTSDVIEALKRNIRQFKARVKRYLLCDNQSPTSGTRIGKTITTGISGRL